MDDDLERSAGERLAALRKRAGVSTAEAGRAIGKSKTGYHYYERAYKKPFLTAEMAERLIPVFAPKGVTAEEVWALTGPLGSPRNHIPANDDAPLGRAAMRLAVNPGEVPADIDGMLKAVRDLLESGPEGYALALGAARKLVSMIERLAPKEAGSRSEPTSTSTP